MSNKFKGILLCTDLDDTLLTTEEKALSNENRQAIEYFISEGGLFTFATGRVPMGAKLVLDIITPNAPMICFNGGAIYDFVNDKILWGRYLDKSAIKVLDYVNENFPHIGFEVCTDNNLYFCKENRIAEQHRINENLPNNYLDYHNILSPLKKAVFLAEEEDMPDFCDKLLRCDFAKNYSFVQSAANYFEILPKGISKGAALLELANILGVSQNRTIGIGDNHNDIEMIKKAGIGIAVANAVAEARNAADIVTVDNDSNAIAAVINSLDVGLIKFKE